MLREPRRPSEQLLRHMRQASEVTATRKKTHHQCQYLARLGVPLPIRMHAYQRRCCGTSTSGHHMTQGGEAAAALAAQAQLRRAPAHGGPGPAASTMPSTAGTSGKGASPPSGLYKVSSHACMLACSRSAQRALIMHPVPGHMFCWCQRQWRHLVLLVMEESMTGAGLRGARRRRLTSRSVRSAPRRRPERGQPPGRRRRPRRMPARCVPPRAFDSSASMAPASLGCLQGCAEC